MSRMYQYGLLLAAVFLANLVVAQSKSVTKSPTASNGHRIEVKIKNFNDSICYLAYRLGDKTYIIDTVKATPDSRYIFEGKEERDPGVYLVLLPPKNRYFEFLLDRGAQKFSMETDTLDFVNNMKLKGTEENTLFFDYLKFLGERRKEAEPLQKELSSAKPEKAKEIKEIMIKRKL